MYSFQTDVKSQVYSSSSERHYFEDHGLQTFPSTHNLWSYRPEYIFKTYFNGLFLIQREPAAPKAVCFQKALLGLAISYALKTSNRSGHSANTLAMRTNPTAHYAWAQDQFLLPSVGLLSSRTWTSCSNTNTQKCMGDKYVI